MVTLYDPAARCACDRETRRIEATDPLASRTTRRECAVFIREAEARAAALDVLRGKVGLFECPEPFASFLKAWSEWPIEPRYTEEDCQARQLLMQEQASAHRRGEPL